jgi:hypothetical protein
MTRTGLAFAPAPLGTGFLTTFYLGFQTLGSIYGNSTASIINAGDIGTSPLYVFTGYEAFVITNEEYFMDPSNLLKTISWELSVVLYGLLL